MKDGNIKLLSLAKIWLWLSVAFAVIFIFIYPPDFHNLGGTHSWLSGVTLKFVNNWLADGIWEDHFTCYESFDSVEFRTKQERTPYLSYPTGSTFAVYLAAKMAGKDHVGIYFLKHFQILWYYAEMLLLATFLYILLTDLAIYAEREKKAVTCLMALFWVLQPVNVWYLANVYFTDQAVIFYIMAFLLFEYISSRGTVSGAGGGKNTVHILKAIIIYFGILTDYYFWVLIFIAFLIRFARSRMLKMQMKYQIREVLWYVCPSVLALGTFIWQISYTDRWFQILISRFVIRTAGDVGGHAFLKYFENFYETLADGSAARGIVLILLEMVIFLLLVRYVGKHGGLRSVILKKEYAIFAIGVLSPLIQIFVLKNHSIMHEFSMIKIGWILTLSILAMAVLIKKMTDQSQMIIRGKKINDYVWTFTVSYVLFLCITGVPFSAGNFLDTRDLQVSYPLEQILYEKARYEEVYFSFTCEIATYPPQRLAVAEKQVHRVDSVEEINSMFCNLPDEAERMLVIEKDAAGKDNSISETEKLLTAENEIVYEDDRYCILRLTKLQG